MFAFLCFFIKPCKPGEAWVIIHRDIILAEALPPHGFSRILFSIDRVAYNQKFPLGLLFPACKGPFSVCAPTHLARGPVYPVVKLDDASEQQRAFMMNNAMLPKNMFFEGGFLFVGDWFAILIFPL